MENLFGSIDFMKFINARIIEIDNDDGRGKTKGVFIPLQENAINTYADNKNAYMSFFSSPMEYPTKKNWTHYIKTYMPKSYLSKVKAIGYKPPIFGYVKPCYLQISKRSSKQHNYVATDILNESDDEY